MAEKEQKYQIGGRTYVQRPLVLGQWQQLMDVAATVQLPAVLDMTAMTIALGKKIQDALAVILTEEGQKPENKDLAEVAKHLQFNIDGEMITEVIDHFLELQGRTFYQRLPAIREKLRALWRKPDGSQNSVSQSQGAISPKETGVSGT